MMHYIGWTIGIFLFRVWAAAMLAGGIKADDERCYAHGGHWTAHGFGLCVNDQGKGAY